MRIPRRLLALLLVFGLVAVACGGDDDTDPDSTTEAGSDDTGSTDDDAAPAEGPVTIEHAFGETVIDEVPERIVAIGAQWTGILLEMDAPLVGMISDGLVEGGVYPWEADLLADEVEVVVATDGIPYEQVAAMDPDLIVVTFAVTDQAGYDALANIAATIPRISEGDGVDTWQDLTAIAGEFMRDADGARSIIDGYEATVADIAAELPELDGAEYTFVNYVPGDGMYVVADPDDGAAQFFAGLGMSISQDIRDVADGPRTHLSFEQIELIDSDLLLILTNGEDTENIVGFEQLDVVKAGAWMEADMALAVAMNTPTALSLRWALDQVKPAFEAAAAAVSES